MEKEISIIIAAYNEEKNIKNCIHSILIQSFLNYEVIIIDDGSIDNTYAICESISRQYTNINVLRQQNEGVSVARNTGIKYASSKWIMFMDADDELVENALMELYNVANEGQSDLIQGKQVYKGNASTELKEIHVESYEPNIVQAVALNRMRYQDSKLQNLSLSVHGCYGKLFKSSIIINNKIFFKEGLGLGEDLLYYMKFLDCCNSVTVIDSPVYLINNNTSSSTRRCNEKMPMFARQFAEEIFALYSCKKRSIEFYDAMCNQVYIHIEVGLVHYLMHKDNKITFYEKYLILKNEMFNNNYSEALNHIYVNNKRKYSLQCIPILLLIKKKIRTYLIFKSLIKYIRDLRSK